MALRGQGIHGQNGRIPSGYSLQVRNVSKWKLQFPSATCRPNIFKKRSVTSLADTQESLFLQFCLGMQQLIRCHCHGPTALSERPKVLDMTCIDVSKHGVRKRAVNTAHIISSQRVQWTCPGKPDLSWIRNESVRDEHPTRVLQEMFVYDVLFSKQQHLRRVQDGSQLWRGKGCSGTVYRYSSLFTRTFTWSLSVK